MPERPLRPTLKHRATFTAPGKPGFQRLQLWASVTEKRVFQQDHKSPGYSQHLAPRDEGAAKRPLMVGWPFKAGIEDPTTTHRRGATVDLLLTVKHFRKSSAP